MQQSHVPFAAPHGHQPSAPQPYWRGDRLVDPRVTDGDRTLTILMHLWWIALPVFGLVLIFPLVAWIVRQSSSGYVDDHGREILNLQLTGLIFLIPPLWPFGVVWALFQMVASIRAAIAASRREHFRYPMTFRPLG